MLINRSRIVTRIVIPIIAIGLFVLDRWFKAMAVGVSPSIWRSEHFVFFPNRGLVFSWPIPAAVALAIMIVAFVIVLMLTIATWRRSWWRFGGASLMLAGATSNLIDRLAHQYIIDYFYFGQHWPVFNIADVIIVVGLGLYLIRRTSTRPVDKFRLPV